MGGLSQWERHQLEPERTSFYPDDDDDDDFDDFYHRCNDFVHRHDDFDQDDDDFYHHDYKFDQYGDNWLTSIEPISASSGKVANNLINMMIIDWPPMSQFQHL